MRIAFHALTLAILGCGGLLSQSVEQSAPTPQQRTTPAPSNPQAQAPAPTQPAPTPFGPSQAGSTAVFQKAPPGVEEALRARLALFYQCQMDGTFRKAEQYVAEDSKDRYYNASHQRYFSFTIVRIEFSEDFSKAELTAVSDVDLRFQGRVIRAPMPFGATWKLENGQWCWYVKTYKPGEVQKTPFGDVITQDAKPERPGDVTEIGKRFATPEEALARFGSSPTLSKAVAVLSKDDKFQDEIIFANTTKVPFKFHIDKDLPPGITIYPMAGQLKPNEGLSMKISYNQEHGSAPSQMFRRVNIIYGDELLKMGFSIKMIP
jgi:hypothetical protein